MGACKEVLGGIGKSNYSYGVSMNSCALRHLFFLVVAAQLSAYGCSDEAGPAVETEPDAEQREDRAPLEDADSVEDQSEEVIPDDVVADPITQEITPDLNADIPDAASEEGFFPDPAEGECVDGGNGARGRLAFDDGEPLVGATVALIVDGEKRLGDTDEEGGFFVQAPCEEIFVEVLEFDSENYPAHPSLTNLPLGTFDASAQQPTFVVPLVTVEGVILDVLGNPIPEARLEADMDDSPVRIYNEQVAHEDGTFAVQLVPWRNAPYRLTARGPQGGDKNYRSATLTIVIVESPSEPTTFVLYEDRCAAPGPVRTSEGTPLEWLYIRVEGEPYEDSVVYYSFDPGFFYDRTQPEVITEELPLFCGTQSMNIWNAIWTDPNWPCQNIANPDQLCMNNYPVHRDLEITEPIEDGIVIPVARARGLVTYDAHGTGTGTPQENVTVRYEARYRWGPGPWDTLTVFNETTTGSTGAYSMVVLPYPDIEYTVTARIRDTDIRPLGEFEDVVIVSNDTDFDIEMPEALPQCVMTGTVHSTEGRDFNEILLNWEGTHSTQVLDGEEVLFDIGDDLYVDPPFRYFSPEPTRYYRWGFPEDEISFIPLLCGDHSVNLHSVDWPGCGGSLDEICFNGFQWWGGGGWHTPGSVSIEDSLDGLEVPVAHLSGFVTDPSGQPVEGIGVSAMLPQGLFSFAMNSTGTDSAGLYDFVVLPEDTWMVSLSMGDDHPRLDDLWPPEPVEIEVPNTGGQANIEMLEGPERCRLSGAITAVPVDEMGDPEGVELERLRFNFYGPWYGMFGWDFRSDEPSVYYRYGNNALLMEAIPLVCGPQTFAASSRRNSFYPSCSNPERFDQPCLSSYAFWQNEDVQEDVDGFEIPVVYIYGTVTRDGETPIEGALVQVVGTVKIDGEEEDTTVVMGGVSNETVTRSDGTYRMAVVPSREPYALTITTPLTDDLGLIESSVCTLETETIIVDDEEVIVPCLERTFTPQDTSVEADFSLDDG